MLNQSLGGRLTFFCLLYPCQLFKLLLEVRSFLHALLALNAIMLLGNFSFATRGQLGVLG